MTLDNLGCPNWKDKDAYPENEKALDVWQWRWEFLRRNPVYREAWNRAETAQTNENGSDIVWDEEIVWDEDAKLNDLFRQYGFPFESDKEIVEHIWHMGKMMLSPKTSLDLIGTQSIFNFNSSVLFSLPSFELIENYFAKNNFTPDHQLKVLWAFLKQTLMISQMEREGKVALAKFDLARPVPPQLKEAKREIQLKLKKINSSINSLKKDRNSNWSRHLRVVDAIDQDATLEGIYEHFADECTGGDDDEMDKFYQEGRQARAVAKRWHNDAIKVMAKVSVLP